jgi:hypothetical protein
MVDLRCLQIEESGGREGGGREELALTPTSVECGLKESYAHDHRDRYLE